MGAPTGVMASLERERKEKKTRPAVNKRADNRNREALVQITKARFIQPILAHIEKEMGRLAF